MQKSNVLNVGSSVSVTLNGTTVKYYAFVPLVSGNITVYTSSSYDTYGYLYGSSLSQLKYNDDDGDGNNFSYTYSVTAGNLYYVGVRAYSSSTTGYATVYISGTQKPTSTATAACADIVGFVYDADSTYITSCEYNDDFALPVPTREGYTFNGWFDGVGGTSARYTDANGESVKAWDKAEDTTLYAKWVAITYDISYNLEGGNNHANNPSIYTIDTETFCLEKPSKQGYSFIGWTSATVTTPRMNYIITSGSKGDITLTANWIEYDVLDIDYDTTTNYIGINTPLTAEYFGATCLDTDNNEVDVTVTYTGNVIGGQCVDVVLTAESRGKVSTITIDDVKVYGIPTITVDNTVINSNDAIVASTFDAIARDSFGGNLAVSIELFEGNTTGGGNKVYTFIAEDKCGNVVRINEPIMVYSADDITFNITNATAIKGSSNGEEFLASATDSFGNTCNVEFIVRDGYTLEAGEVISVCFKATDVNGNIKNSQVLTNVKVYGEPTIVCDLPKITAETNVNEIFRVVDSFGIELETEAQFTGNLVEGSNVGVRIIAQDAAGNLINEERTVYVICVNHAISANCTCETCGEVVHTIGENDDCLICGTHIDNH